MFVPSAAEHEMEDRLVLGVQLVVDATQPFDGELEAGLLQQFPSRRVLRRLMGIGRATRQLPVQAAVRVVHEEDLPAVIKDRAGRSEGNPARPRSVGAHRPRVGRRF